MALGRWPGISLSLGQCRNVDSGIKENRPRLGVAPLGCGSSSQFHRSRRPCICCPWVRPAEPSRLPLRLWSWGQRNGRCLSFWNPHAGLRQTPLWINFPGAGEPACLRALPPLATVTLLWEARGGKRLDLKDKTMLLVFYKCQEETNPPRNT